MQNSGVSGAQAAVQIPKSFNAGMGHELAGIIRNSGNRQISIAQLQKTAQTPNALATDTSLRDYSNISGGFIGALSNSNAFDGMISSMVPLPMRTGTIGAVSVNATAYALNEMDMKPMSRLSFTNKNQDPLKAAVLVPFSKELVRFAPPGTLQLIERQLKRAVSVVTDQKFLSEMTTGVNANTSTGSTAESVRADISGLLSQVTLDADSKPYLITTTTILKRWTMLTDQHGIGAFPQLTPMGGSINGIPVLVSDGVTAGQVILVYASSIGGNAGEMLLTESDQASLQQDSAPDSPQSASTNFVSLWQLNLVAQRVERFFIGEVIRSSSVAVCSNSASYGSGNSPP